MNRSPIIAEWILKLFTTAEQASSITGDLEETHRNRFEFWWAVLRTAGRFLWRDVMGGRRTLAGLAFRGMLMGFVYSLMAIPVMILANHLPWPPANWVLNQIVLIGCGVQTGRWVARRARGREIAAAFAMNAMGVTLGIVLGTAMVLLHKFGATWPDVMSVNPLMCLPPVAGAVLERKGFRLFRRAPLEEV